MYNLVKSILESAETNDFSLKSIDPKEESNNAETDNLLYNEAYEKACIGIKTCYDLHAKLFREFIHNVRHEHENISIDRDKNYKVELHTISINPQIDFNVLKMLDDFFSNKEMSSYNTSDEVLDEISCHVISQSGRTPSQESYMGAIVTTSIKGSVIAVNLVDIERNSMNAADELYSAYEYLSKKICEAKTPLELESYARIFEYCAKLISYEIGSYGVALIELIRIVRSSINTITEAATNEESAKEYISEIDKLVSEIRDFYDKFEYKEIIIPRKKKESKMYEYVLGALQRKYTLRIPIYKVEGASEDVKDIVENKFINKLESITKKYPNFVILSPKWDDEEDMFIYITLREPFGEKEDRDNREKQTQNESVILNEDALSKSEKESLEDYEFGIPEKRQYPLNDETRIRKAIQFFGYCKASYKNTLADNIIRRIIELDLVGIVTITEKHPNKKYFPDWMLNTCKPILEKKGNKYSIFVDGEKVDYGTLEDHSSDEDARIVVVNENGNLF